MAVVTFSNIKGGGGGTLTGITFLNSDYTLDFIESAVTEAVESGMTGYTKTVDFATINGSAITEGGNLVIEGGGSEYSAGTNIDITENVISVTGITIPTSNTAFTNDAGYITSGDAQTQINDSISGAMSAYTPTSGFSTINGSAITEGGNITVEETPYSAGTNIAISDHVISVTGISVPTKLSDLQNDLNFVDSGDVQTQINDSVSGKQDSSAMTEYYTSAQTDSAISNAVTAATSGLASETYVDNAVSGKADTSALTQYWTSAETQNAITAATDDMATQTWVGQQGYLTAFTETDPIFQASAASGITSGDITNWNAKLDSSALTPYYTSAQTDTAISNATSGLASTTYVDNSVSGKQDTLVSGTNIKTINNESLLGSGNITISGGSQIIELTQSEYDALTAITPDTLYVISDAPSIELVASITSASTDTQLPSAKAVYDLINGN